MPVNLSKFAYGLLVVLVAGSTTLLAAAGQPGGPLEGGWFVAPLVGIPQARGPHRRPG